MTTTTYTYPHIRKDVEQDRPTDGRLDTGAHDDRIGPAFVIVLANHKGGVTKTTSTANLGACLAEAGQTVLIVDADPQANLSEAFGWSEDVPGERLEDLLRHHEAAARYQPPVALLSDVAGRSGVARAVADHSVHRRPGRCRR